MSAPTIAAGLGATVAMAYSANRHVAILGDDEGRLSVLDLRRPTSSGHDWRVAGRGYRDIGHLAYDDISDRLVIVDADGAWVARLPVADRADATAFVVSPGDVLAVHTVSMAGAPPRRSSKAARHRASPRTTLAPNRVRGSALSSDPWSARGTP